MRAAAFGSLPLVLSLLLATAPHTIARQAPPDASREALIRRLNTIAHEREAARAAQVAALDSRDAVLERQQEVRRKILDLIGGLPPTRSDLAVNTTSPTLTGDGFRIERVMYHSLPGLPVTANVYVPATGPGPFPAVLLSPGHSPGGKTELYDIGGNLARAGFVALAWDPVGQGERLQHFDPDLGASKVGRPTGEHGHDGVQTMLLGEHVSRYFVWDAMRGIDYLSTRPDVDAQRIGAFGCSGGGTVTAYLAALDPRVKAAASACYMTTVDALVESQTGVQEGEQSIPGFVTAGLDFADWILLAAPRPYAIVSTTEDMFPFDGATRTYEEAKRVYGLMGAEASLRFITGPGGHGALGPLYGDIIGFFAKALGSKGAAPAFARLAPRSPEDFLVTSTGQVSTALPGSATIQSINRARMSDLASSPDRSAPSFTNSLRQAVVRHTGVTVRPGGEAPAARMLGHTVRDHMAVDRVAIASPDGDLTLMAVTSAEAGTLPRRITLMLQPDVPADGAPGADVTRLARAGHLVVIVPGRPWPAGSEEIKSPLLGTSYLLSLRAMLVGRTLVGLRVDDALRAADWAAAQPGVDRTAMGICGVGPLGVVALHAAMLDERLSRVVVEGSIATWRAIVEQPLHRNASEVVVPGVLRHYDLPDLVAAIAPRSVTVVNPVDAMGNALRRAEAQRLVSPTPRDGAATGPDGRVRLVWRGPRDPLPID